MRGYAGLGQYLTRVAAERLLRSRLGGLGDWSDTALNLTNTLANVGGKAFDAYMQLQAADQVAEATKAKLAQAQAQLAAAQAAQAAAQTQVQAAQIADPMAANAGIAAAAQQPQRGFAASIPAWAWVVGGLAAGGVAYHLATRK